MSIDTDKWANRIYRQPKKGRDYVSERESSQRGSRAVSTGLVANGDDQSANIGRLYEEVADMQLVINLLSQRLDRLENAPPIEAQLVTLQRKLRRLGVVTTLLGAGVLLFVLWHSPLLARITEINIGSELADIVGQIKSKFGL
jgi:hypothetical protein